MKKLLSVKIPENTVSHVIGKSAQLTEKVESVLDSCPHCKKSWPKSEKPNKVPYGIRLEESLEKRLKKVDNKGHLFTVASMLMSGLCPVCGQKK